MFNTKRPRGFEIDHSSKIDCLPEGQVIHFSTLENYVDGVRRLSKLVDEITI
jgi:hypothetical protein